MSEQPFAENDAPLDERIQHALIGALGEDDGIHAYDEIKPLLKELWDGGHFCGVLCERDDVKRCHHSPFYTRPLAPGRKS